MAVAVVCSAGNHCTGGADRLEEFIAGGSGTAMMAQLQDVGLQGKAAFRHSFFRRSLRIAAHNEGIGAKGQPDSNGQVVQITVLCRLFGNVCGRGENGKISLPKRIGIARLWSGDPKLLFQKRIQHILIGPRCMGYVWQDDRADVKCMDNVIHPADMILMGMCSYQIG